jgi:Fe-S cluster assembly protein SufD
LFASAGGRRLVFVDGTLVPELSQLSDLPKGLTIYSMADALASSDQLTATHLGKVLPVHDPALALNTALMGDGVVINVAANTVIAEPLILAFVTTGDAATATFTRSLVIVGQGARLTLIESHEGPSKSDYQVNTVLEFSLGEDSRVDHLKFTREGPAALHVGSVLAALDTRAQFNGCYYTIGGSLVRNQVFVRIAGEGATASISGASLLAGKQHGDSTLSIDHVAGGCQSRELFKSVLDDEAHVVFQGRIRVQPHAQKTDARMMSRTLLLSDATEADCKPELEIFADDVQCGHGSTTGALDPELKFYSMASTMKRFATS